MFWALYSWGGGLLLQAALELDELDEMAMELKKWALSWRFWHANVEAEKVPARLFNFLSNRAYNEGTLPKTAETFQSHNRSIHIFMIVALTAL